MADTYNQKTDRQDTAGSVYQREIFKRRSRYILVFSVLTAAFFVVTVLNINTGNVHISLPEILKILARRGEGGTEETRGKNGVGKACGERKRGCDGVPFPAACHDPAAGVVFL